HILIIPEFFELELVCRESAFEVPILAVLAADFVAVRFELNALDVGPVRPDECQLPSAGDVAAYGGSGGALGNGKEKRDDGEEAARNCVGHSGGGFHWRL